MNLKNIFMKDATLVIDEVDNANEFASLYASYMKNVCISMKDASGKVSFNSSIAVVDNNKVKNINDFVEIMNAIGIDIYASINMFTDEWSGRDNMYKVVDDVNNTSFYICPNREKIVSYNSEIIKEIINNGINNIFIHNIGYPGKRFCFCEQCKKDFSDKYNIETCRINITSIKDDDELFALWNEFRTDKVYENISKIVDDIKTLDTGDEPVKIIPEIMLEHESIGDYCTSHAYDIERIVHITKNILINILPWQSQIPHKDSEELIKISEKIADIRRKLQPQALIFLYRWGINDEDLESMVALNKMSMCNGVIVNTNIPKNYSTYREIAIGNY